MIDVKLKLSGVITFGHLLYFVDSKRFRQNGNVTVGTNEGTSPC